MRFARKGGWIGLSLLLCYSPLRGREPASVIRETGMLFWIVAGPALSGVLSSWRVFCFTTVCRHVMSFTLSLSSYKNESAVCLLSLSDCSNSWCYLKCCYLFDVKSGVDTRGSWWVIGTICAQDWNNKIPFFLLLMSAELPRKIMLQKRKSRDRRKSCYRREGCREC